MRRTSLRVVATMLPAGTMLPAAGAVLLAAVGYVVYRSSDHAGRVGALAEGLAGVAVVFGLLVAFRWAALAGQRQREEEMHDALTGLPNRAHLLGTIERAVAAARGGDGSVGLFVLDLDRFREVNDILGHRIGDQLLQQVARRLESVVRPGDSVARLGGDEFGKREKEQCGIS